MSDKQKLHDDLIELGVLRERQRILEIARTEQHKFLERGDFNYHDFVRAIKGETD